MESFQQQQQQRERKGMRNLKLSLLLTSLLSTGAFAAGDIKLTHKKKLTLPRIIGGVEAPKGEFPWMASIQSKGDHFCGGSVIDSDWILTAAHCVEDETAANIKVRVNFTQHNDASQGEIHEVDKIFVKQAYLDGKSEDIAMLKLKTKVSSAVSKITLANENLMLSAAKPGVTATVAGWGNRSTDGEDFPQKLQKVDVPIVTNAVCNSKEAYNGKIQTTEVCAGFAKGGKDSCQGDSGGPLVVRQNGAFIQAGIVSWGDGCAAPNKYGVYARVASFQSWIADVKAGKVNESTGGGNAGGGNTGGGNNGGGETATGVNAGELFTGLSGKADDQILYSIEVPEGTRMLWVDTRGGEGDVDLYLRHGEEPTTDNFDFAHSQEGNSEYIIVELPESGKWNIMVHGYSDFSNVELLTFTR